MASTYFSVMPELPEVETIRRGLDPRVVGRIIASIDLRLPRLFEGDSAALDGLAGWKVLATDRRGKYLLFRLGQGRVARHLVVHLGMSGQLTWVEEGEQPVDRFERLPSGLMKPIGPHSIDRHTHLVVRFRGGGALLFRDPRTFGRILLLEHDAQHARLGRLGPDALVTGVAEFSERFARLAGRRAVKAVLLDQGFLAGIGNIYADEACFEARILPGRAASDLSHTEIAALANAVGVVLRRGIENSGTTFRDYRDAVGVRGRNAEDLRVYGRGGEPCRSCGLPLQKGVVAQRSTVWCPRCQE